MDRVVAAGTAGDACAVAPRAAVVVRIGVRPAIYLASFGVIAVYFLIWPIWRAQFPLEIWPTEGWNGYLQDAAGSFRSLYPAAGDLTGNNYPPLSFYAVGLLGKLLGADNLYVGRALSLVGLSGVALEIFLCGRILVRSNIGPAIGALWFVAIMAHNSTIYVGANDPQIAGEAIMGAALALFLRADRDRRSPVPALLLMVVGGFWKHNMIAIPLTATIWLLLRDRSKASRPLLISFAAIVIGFVVCGLSFGGRFFDDLLAPRGYHFGNVLARAGHLQWCALAFAIWAVWAISDRRSKAASFTSLHIACGLGASVLQWFGDGVMGNAEFDLLIALGIAVGVTFARMDHSWFARYVRTNYLRDAMVLALLLRLIVTERQETALLLLSPQFRSYFDVGTHEVKAEAAAISAIPGPVYCSNDVICRLAGKAYVVDEFKVEELLKTGRISFDGLADKIRHDQITAFHNSRSTEWSSDTSILR